ncbi:MAG: hypothetical protein EAZ08_06585 [Cytophagales bacterium]|nr:MAG: hypothetical protein EAZ08_06585 [Cytophagales bacterium]
MNTNKKDYEVNSTITDKKWRFGLFYYSYRNPKNLNEWIKEKIPRPCLIRHQYIKEQYTVLKVQNAQGDYPCLIKLSEDEFVKSKLRYRTSKINLIEQIEVRKEDIKCYLGYASESLIKKILREEDKY